MYAKLPTPLVLLHPRMQFDQTVPLRSPAVVLRDDYMLPDDLTVANVARRAGIPTRQMGRILDGAPINTEEALRFAALFDTSALYWLLLQVHHNLEYVRRQVAPGGPGRMAITRNVSGSDRKTGPRPWEIRGASVLLGADEAP